MDVGGGIVPFVELSRGSFKVLPHLGTVKDVVVGFLEHLGGDDFAGNRGDLVTRWPDVSKENVLAVLVLTKRGLLEVEVD